MSHYFKIESAPGSSGTGLWRINFYDQNDIMIPLKFENVVSYNATNRISANEFETMLNNTSGYNPPYRSLQGTLEYVIEISDDYEGLSKLSIQNWTNGTYSTSSTTISYSTDNITYEVIETKNMVYNQRYDFLVNFEFMKKRYLLKSNNKTYSLKLDETKYDTKMTSNIAPSPFVASASSQYNSTYAPWKAFNGTATNDNDRWRSANSQSENWIQIDFGQKKLVNKLTIQSVNDATTVVGTPVKFNLYGTDDGINLINIGNISSDAYLVGEIKDFYLEYPQNYRMYRIEPIENQGNVNHYSIGDVLFYYQTNVTEIPNDSLSNMLNYGSSSIGNFKLRSSTKKYVLQSDSSRNNDGFLEKTLNRKPLTIKFK